MTRRKALKKCPLVAHYAAPNGCCIGCGKTYQANKRKSNPFQAVLGIFDPTITGGVRVHTSPPKRTHKAAETWAKKEAKRHPGREVITTIKENPGVRAKRIGRVRKIFYDRDQGKRQGLYYHTFRRRGAGLWTEPNGKVSIR